jgi:hypothetical protein
MDVEEQRSRDEKQPGLMLPQVKRKTAAGLRHLGPLLGLGVDQRRTGTATHRACITTGSKHIPPHMRLIHILQCIH